jgi:adhesin transport system membrane fusion protein
MTTPVKRPFAVRHLSMTSLLFIGLIIFVLWTALFEIDQSVRAQGLVIASARTQIIQSADGGIVSALNVAEGEQVKAGQVLAVLEKGRAEAGFEESRARVAALRVARIRAVAEVRMATPDFSAERSSYPKFIQAQQSLFLQRKRTLEEDSAALGSALDMAREELRMNEALFKDGDVSRLEIFRARRQANELEARVASVRNKYRQEASAEIAKIEEELASAGSKQSERQNILDHTDLIAPVAGVVKLLRITTIGGVLRPGDELMQIAPTDDALIVEAKVDPRDVGGLHTGLPVSVKIDAFDYSVYGTLSGTLTYISPDTLSEPGATSQPAQSFYRVHVVLKKPPGLGDPTREIIIKPGMTAGIDIRTGTRSILKYIAKPVFKAFGGALNER